MCWWRWEGRVGIVSSVSWEFIWEDLREVVGIVVMMVEEVGKAL